MHWLGITSMTSKRHGVAENQIAAASLFLNAVLADGPVAVAELEFKARAAGLLGQRQEITNSKLFKAAKKILRVRSKRTGFGRNGVWAWSCSTQTNLVETAADIAPQAADHSRPTRHAEPKACSDLDVVGETALNHSVAQAWAWGVGLFPHGA